MIFHRRLVFVIALPLSIALAVVSWYLTRTTTPPRPVVRTVSPYVLDLPSLGVSTTVSITGTHFRTGALVMLYHQRAVVEQLHASSITARVSSDLLTPGWYDVVVQNPDGQAGILHNAFAVRDEQGNIPERFYTIRRSNGTFAFAAEGSLHQTISTYNINSPHYSHLNVVDLGRSVPFLSEPYKSLAVSWYASHVDIAGVAMKSDIYFQSPGASSFFTSTTLKQLNPTVKTFGYDIDMVLYQHLGAAAFNSDGTPNANLNANLPNDERLYLHFGTTTTVDFYDLRGNKGFIDKPNGQGVYNGVQDAGEPSIPSETITGCADLQHLTASCRVKEFNYLDYNYASDIRSPAWRTWMAAKTIAETSDASVTPPNVVDGVFFDARGPGFSIPNGFGFQTKIAAGQPATAGKILEYAINGHEGIPKSTFYGTFNQLDDDFNNDLETWNAYLTQQLQGAGKFFLPNYAGYSIMPEALTQILNAKGLLTELLSQPNGFTAGQTGYQTFLNLMNNDTTKGDPFNGLVRQAGSVTDLFGNPCQYAPELNPSGFTAGNYDTANHRWLMWRLAHYYMVRELPSSPGTAYFDPNLCVTTNLSFEQDWMVANEFDVGQPIEYKGTLLKTGNGNTVHCIVAGSTYGVFVRHYTNAEVLVRPSDLRDPNCSEWGDPSAVTINMDNYFSTGSYYHMLKADGTLGAATTSVQIRNADAAIMIPNHAPSLDPLTDQTVLENQLLTFDATAADSDGDAVTLTAQNLPPGATFLASGAGRATFSWTPSYTQAGTYTVTFGANDISLTSSRTVTITVTDVNRSPVLTPISDKSAVVGQLLTFPITASDPDGDVLTTTVTGLPAGATVQNNVFSWTPSVAQSGTVTTIHVQVSDGRLAATQDVTLTVAQLPPPTNHSPVLSIVPPQFISEGQLLSINVTATDPDNDPVSFLASNLPYGAIFVDNANNSATLRWTPTFDQAGQYSVLVTGSDGTATTGETVLITVNDTNRVPVITAPGNQTVAEETPLNFSVTAADADGDILSFSALQLPTGASFGQQLFQWTPARGQAGTYTMIFRVSDGHVDVDVSVPVTVTAALTPPPSDQNPPTPPESLPPISLSPSGGAFPPSLPFTAFSVQKTNGFTIASGNVWGDVRDELVVGSGSGMEPTVKVFSNDGRLRGQFTPFPKSFRGGVRVAVCDLNGDHRDEILVSSGSPSLPFVRIFNGIGKRVLAKQIWVLDGHTLGGVDIACGDIDHDGKAEIIAGSEKGSGHVTVHRASGSRIANFFPFGKRFKGGVRVAVLNAGTSSASLLASAQTGSSKVVILSPRGKQQGSTLHPYSGSQKSGANIAAGDLDGDGTQEILTAPAERAQPVIKVYSAETRRQLATFSAYSKSVTGGVRLASGDVDYDGADDILTIPANKAPASVRELDETGTQQ